MEKLRVRTIGVTFLFVLVAAAISWFGLTQWFRHRSQTTQISPLVPGSVIQVQEPVVGSSDPKQVYGYVPYWTLLSATPSAVLTDVSYFSLTLGADGKIVEQTADGPDMGLRRMQAESFTEWLQARAAAGQRAHITFTMLNNADISAFLSSPTAQSAAVQNITQVMASYPFSGLNLDVEYAGQATDQQRAAYSKFVADVRRAVDAQSPGVELSVAIFGSAASRPLLWDIAALEPSVDAFIMMAYDYHVRSSTTSGPVAPIFGKQAGRWQDDIITNLRDLLEFTPSEKILLGVPFYGYEWTTTSVQPGSNTFPRSGATATYDRVNKILRGETPVSQLVTRWDEEALSPYLVYRDGSDIQMIYYENARSLAYKLDLVNQVNLRGIAIWAVGYEGNSTELWDVIDSRL